MGVGRGNEDLLHGDAGFLRGDPLGLDDERGIKAEIVDHDRGEGGLAVIEDEGAGVERIMGALGEIRTEPARHVQREPLRRDIRRKGPGAEDRFVLSAERESGEEGGEKKKGADHGGVMTMEPWQRGSEQGRRDA